MPSASKVRPGKWSEVVVVFDNGWYSVIAGKYEGTFTLGERWNGDGNSIGFPRQGKYPVWHVIPDFMHRPVLYGLLEELSRWNGPERAEYAAATSNVLKQLIVAAT